MSMERLSVSESWRQVYNITPYLEYHPGGVPELMRAAGIDGTALFDEVHRWVNFEAMLSNCYVGDLAVAPRGRGDRDGAGVAVPLPVVMSTRSGSVVAVGSACGAGPAVAVLLTVVCSSVPVEVQVR